MSRLCSAYYCLFAEEADTRQARHALSDAVRQYPREVGPGQHVEAAVHPYGEGERPRLGTLAAVHREGCADDTYPDHTAIRSLPCTISTPA